jgi:hypothetical protein
MLKGTKGKFLFLRTRIATIIIIGGRLEDNKDKYEE